LTDVQTSGSLYDMKALTVRLPDELHKKLKLHSVDIGKDMAVIVTELLEQYFSKVENGPAPKGRLAKTKPKK
jgi:plasmid stability protein